MPPFTEKSTLAADIAAAVKRAELEVKDEEKLRLFKRYLRLASESL